MDDLLKKAAEFLRDHPEINEVELESGTGIGRVRVHLIRLTSIPTTYAGWTYYPNYLSYQTPGT